MTPDLLTMIRRYSREGEGGAALLSEFRQRVGWVARPYPDIWFALGRKTDDAIDDLTHRVFVACCTLRRPGFPYRGRTPFAAFVEDGADTSRILACCFTSRWSLTRETMRSDYAYNTVRDPRARWEAELHASIGVALADCATSEQHLRRGPRVWSLPGAQLPTARLSDDDLVGRLRTEGASVEAAVVSALALAGPMTQRRLTTVLGRVLGGPPLTREQAIEPDQDPADPDAGPVDAAPDEAAIRREVGEAWRSLSEDERELLGWVAAGLTGREIVLRRPSLNHEVRVTRIKQQCEKKFMEHLAAAFGGVVTDGMLDIILEILAPSIELREAS